MSSSVSKLIGGQGQHRQQAALHPAAAVFCDEILGNVGDRNKALEANNARFRHLADLIQDIELSFFTRSSRRGEQENHVHIEHHETFTLKQKLGQGKIITTLDDEERFVLPIEDAPAHPVEDCGAIGCVKLYMAGGVPFGSFPEACVFVHDAAKKSVEEDSSVLLFLHFSEEIVIKGKLLSSQMTNEALIEHVEHTNFMSCLTSPMGTFISSLTLPGGGIGTGLFDGVGEYRKGIVFTPLSISIQVTPWLKETLALIDQVSSPGGSRADVELESEDGLRRLVVEALGDSEHKEMFNEYIELKHENQPLTELRSLMFGVSVSHSMGSFTVNLDEGMKSGVVWAIKGNRFVEMPVSELHSIQASFLGMQLRLCNGNELIREWERIVQDVSFRRVWPMQFQAGSTNLKFYLIVMLNWDELMEEDIEGILDNFSSKMSNALGFGRNTIFEFVRNDTATFPSSFKANLLGIACDLSMAKRRLQRVGLWEE